MTYSTQKAIGLIYGLHVKYRGLLTAKEADIISMILITEMEAIDDAFSAKEIDFPRVQDTVIQMIADLVTKVLKRQEELRAIGGLTSPKAQKDTGIRINGDGGI